MPQRTYKNPLAQKYSVIRNTRFGKIEDGFDTLQEAREFAKRKGGKVIIKRK